VELRVIWLVAALVFGVGEMHAQGFVLAPLALGALGAAGPSLVGVGGPLSRMQPELARGDANKVFVIPSEFTQAFADIGSAVAGRPRAARAIGSKATLAAAPGPDPTDTAA
jgi:hypothetical protein